MSNKNNPPFVKVDGNIITILPLRIDDPNMKNIPSNHTWIASFVIKGKTKNTTAYETGPSIDVAKNRLLKLLTKSY